jgi:hypothetical protein
MPSKQTKPTSRELVALAKHLTVEILALNDAVASLREQLLSQAQLKKHSVRNGRLRVVCGAPTRSTGLPCRAQSERGQEHCRLHGGVPKWVPRARRKKQASKEGPISVPGHDCTESPATPDSSEPGA